MNINFSSNLSSSFVSLSAKFVFVEKYRINPGVNIPFLCKYVLIDDECFLQKRFLYCECIAYRSTRLLPLWHYQAIICPYYLACIGPLSCVPNVASLSGLSFFIVPSVISNYFVLCLVYPMLSVSLDSSVCFPLGILQHLFVLCTLCCALLWIVLIF